MTRRRTKKARKKPSSAWQRLRSWRPSWPKGWHLSWLRDVGPIQSEAAGLFLLIMAILTTLGLLDVSSGAILDWWATALRRVFGWGAYVVAIGMAGSGVWLLWDQVRDRILIGPATIVGLELSFLSLLAASHAPLVLRAGVDQAFLAAEAGQAGGTVGWALAVLLMEGLGALVGSVVLVGVLLIGLYLLFSLSWADLEEWLQRQSRLVAAVLSRWWMVRQGTPVVPEAPEVPWWEQEVEVVKAAPAKKGPSRSRKKPSARRPSEGTLPPLDLLDLGSPQAYGDADVRQKARLIEETLQSFGVPAEVVEVSQGPTVTQFGLDPGYIERRVSGGEVRQQRVRVAKIAALANDLALALAASPIRIEAPVPGRSVVGLEVPNEKVSLVSLRGVLESPEFKEIDSRLAIALGEDVSGHPAAVDLALMPHLLIAGATGSGKSVCMNAIICCLLLNNTPDDLKMLMVDPKMVELVGYNDVPHLVAPVVVDLEQVVGALAWVTRQMDERYRLFNQLSVRNLAEYNRKVLRRKGQDPLPAMVVLIDELADLMMVAADEVERHICRLAQMGRATGIHLVIATQRPSVDVVTGLIKANFPARVSFAVTSQIDSRVVLDQGGAESLLGRGDMLFMAPQLAAPIRLQGCFVSDKEIGRLTGFWRDQDWGGAQRELFPPWTTYESDEEPDDMLQQAIEVIRGRDRVSTSFMQRQLRIGFPRAARLMDQLEQRQAVGPDEGGGRGRAVLLGRGIDFDEIEERLPGVEPD
jgi:S-DNA-T family DNA segregation ATPase FtsK/SpoIIIE